MESWVKIVGGAIAAVAAILATFKALAEWRRANQQRRDELQLREREFRHKQALFARDLVRETFSDKKARVALNMLDWISRDYTDDEGAKHRINRSEIQHAMRPDPGQCTPAEVFIRTRFESLYDYLENVERMIELGIVDFADVETAFRYYMVRLNRRDIRHPSFFNYYDYPRTRKFVARFENMPDTGRDTAATA